MISIFSHHPTCVSSMCGTVLPQRKGATPGHLADGGLQIQPSPQSFLLRTDQLGAPSTQTVTSHPPSVLRSVAVSGIPSVPAACTPKRSNLARVTHLHADVPRLLFVFLLSPCLPYFSLPHFLFLSIGPLPADIALLS